MFIAEILLGFACHYSLDESIGSRATALPLDFSCTILKVQRNNVNLK